MRVGDDKVTPIDVRIIAATNKNLMDLIRQGKFREDLYYRLNILSLHIPPAQGKKGGYPRAYRFSSSGEYSGTAEQERDLQ